MFVDAVIGQAIVGDGDHRTQERQVRPQAVISGDVCALQLPRARRPHAFTGIVGVPDVEVAHLGTNGRGHTKHMTGGDFPGTTGTDRHFELLNQGTAILRFANAVVKAFVDLQRSPFADLISRWIILVHDVSSLVFWVTAQDVQEQ
ncbi:hypothetical protein D3C73_917340 [compost metagenome]